MDKCCGHRMICQAWCNAVLPYNSVSCVMIPLLLIIHKQVYPFVYIELWATGSFMMLRIQVIVEMQYHFATSFTCPVCQGVSMQAGFVAST